MTVLVPEFGLLAWTLTNAILLALFVFFVVRFLRKQSKKKSGVNRSR